MTDYCTAMEVRALVAMIGLQGLDPLKKKPYTELEPWQEDVAQKAFEGHLGSCLVVKPLEGIRQANSFTGSIL